ncbi:MAG: methyltransferase domain-containing protein [Acidobacteria bacterium]|nr:methyltransferase domain-containing protein [Acidobacteriota bacterium]
MDRRDAYRLAAPFYDLAMAGLLRQARRDSLGSLTLAPGARLLIAGAGTGLDFPHLPGDLDAVALDLAPEMLRRARRRIGGLGLEKVVLLRGDAQRLPFQDGSFDGALLHLILAVAPSGRRVLAEACRCVRPGGRLSVLDKFLPDEAAAVPMWRKLAQGPMLPFTDLNRRFGPMREGLPIRVLRDDPVLLRGMFRRILLERE